MSDLLTRFRRFYLLLLVLIVGGMFCFASPVLADEETPETPAAPVTQMGVKQLLEAGGTIGYIILGLSVAMGALIVEHLFSIRRSALMPNGVAEEVHRALSQQRYQDADQICKSRPSFLSHVLSAGIGEIPLGYSAVEKAMEDASVQQAAKLLRKIEYLSIIGTIAPMLGLLGTVWGIMLAFLQFSLKANPHVSELAPGIYTALVTTLFGLCVAIPALSAFAIMRSRIDEYVAETALLAERVFLDFKRTLATRKKKSGESGPEPPPTPPGAMAPSIRIQRKE